METTQVPVNWWINKKDLAHIHKGILFSHEKGGYPGICNNVHGPWAHYGKLDKKDKYCKILLVCEI